MINSSRRHRDLDPFLRFPLLAVLILVVGISTISPGIASSDDDDSDDNPIRIGIIGDQTFSTDIQASYAVLQQAVNRLSSHNLDVVLHVGDLVESTLSPAEVEALFTQATGILDQLPSPWYLTAGDHDVNPPGFQQDSSDRSREQLFQTLYGARVPAFAVHPYYSFNVGDFHFIALYSEQALHADPRFGNIFLAQVYGDQLAWLANDLEANRDARAIIVFLHQPLWYHWSGWQPVHELLRRYPVAAVISGHFHYDQDNGRLDGIRYLTVGATGGFTKQGSRDAGDIDHVSVLRVAGPRRARLRLISLSDNLPLEITPRVDMDRIQAMDVQFDNFFDFAQRNPVFVENGQLVQSCGGSSPATLTITQLGDPTDLPLDVRIQFSSSPSGISLDTPAFTPGQCQQVISNTECVLARTARTFISNYSSVLIDEFFSPRLWQSGLSAGSPQPGTVLSLELRTTIEGASGPLFLERTVSTTVQACP
jgi:Calcineurin-like phosphoesterase